MGGRAGGGAERQASRVPMGDRGRRAGGRRVGQTRGTRKAVGVGSRADNLSNPLWDELGHAPPRIRTPPPPGPGGWPAGLAGLLPLPAGGGGGAGGSDTCLPGPGASGRPPQPPACAGAAPGRSAARGLAESQALRGFAEDNMAVPSGPAQWRAAHASGRPPVTRPAGTAASSPRARVCGSRPFGRCTTWRGRTRGGIRVARGRRRAGARGPAAGRAEQRPDASCPSAPVTCFHRGGTSLRLRAAGGRLPTLRRALRGGGRRFVRRWSGRGSDAPCLPPTRPSDAGPSSRAAAGRSACSQAPDDAAASGEARARRPGPHAGARPVRGSRPGVASRGAAEELQPGPRAGGRRSCARRAPHCLSARTRPGLR